MAEYHLTNKQARQFMLRWQGLLGAPRFSGRDGLLAYVRQAGCVQFDPVDVCGKNAELVLFSRVRGFKKAMLEKELYKHRTLVDHWDKNMSIYLAEDWPYFARNRERFRGWAYREESMAAVKAATGTVRDFVAERGVACSRELDLGVVVDWAWAPANLSRATLEYLYFTGELIIHHRQGTVRHYAPAAHHLPADLLEAPDPYPADGDYHVWHTARRIAAVGLLWNLSSPAFLGIPEFGSKARTDAFARLEAEGQILPCRVEGVNASEPDIPLYISAAAEPALQEVLAGRGFAPRVEFIGPLDSLIWDRKLIRALFGFDYTWEIYTPVIKRKYGHYVLPVLWGTGFAGRVEIIADRPAKRLEVRHFWPEERFKPSRAFLEKFHKRLEAFARFNGCGTLDLAPDCGLPALHCGPPARPGT